MKSELSPIGTEIMLRPLLVSICLVMLSGPITAQAGGSDLASGMKTPNLELSLKIALGDDDHGHSDMQEIGAAFTNSQARAVPCAADSPCDQLWRENPYGSASEILPEVPLQQSRPMLALTVIGLVLLGSLLPGGRRSRRNST